MPKKTKFVAVSAVTRLEILAGANPLQMDFWDVFLQKIEVLPFDADCAVRSAEIVKQLKSSNQLLEIPDIMIAGTALSRQIPLATLNVKHFSRMQGISLITPNI